MDLSAGVAAGMCAGLAVGAGITVGATLTVETGVGVATGTDSSPHAVSDAAAAKDAAPITTTRSNKRKTLASLQQHNCVLLSGLYMARPRARGPGNSYLFANLGLFNGPDRMRWIGDKVPRG